MNGPGLFDIHPCRGKNENVVGKSHDLGEKAFRRMRNKKSRSGKDNGGSLSRHASHAENRPGKNGGKRRRKHHLVNGLPPGGPQSIGSMAIVRRYRLESRLRSSHDHRKSQASQSKPRRKEGRSEPEKDAEERESEKTEYHRRNSRKAPDGEA